MTWARLDDGIYRNHKLLACSPSARWFYIAAIAYCRDQQTAGRLDISATKFLVRGQGVSYRVLGELEAAGCLVMAEGSWEIHDYEQFNPLTSTERVRKHRRNAQGTPGNANETPEKRPLASAPATGMETISKTGSRPVPIPVPGGNAQAVSKTATNAAEQAERFRQLATPFQAGKGGS